MSEIKQLPESDYEAFVTICANAYPSMGIVSEEDRQRMFARLQDANNSSNRRVYGLYREGQLLGGMIFYDLPMQLLSVQALTGGVGMVAVDLLHKKERVAFEMLRFFLQHYRKRGAPLALLYPFRPDFYRKMGFSAGTPLLEYRVRAADLPKGESKAQVVLLQPEERELVRDCYHRCMARTHGLIAKSDHELQQLFRPKRYVTAYKQGDQVQGYAAFSFEAGGNFLHNNIVVHELFYENPTALSQLFTFLHSQADQIDRVIFYTQDEDFHHLFADPRNGGGRLLPSVFHESATHAIGVMYRVIDTPGLFRTLAEHRFGVDSCTFQLTIHDSFLPENAGSTLVQIQDGRPQVLADGTPQFTISMEVGVFSALVMGTARFRSLHAYGLAEISDPQAVELVDRLFLTSKPICTTPF